MIPTFRYYLFDIDGTLLDSAADIVAAASQVLAEAGHPGVTEDYVRRFIGRPLIEMLEDLFPGTEPAQLENLREAYRNAYRLRDHRATRLFPGVAEMLARLPGKKATVTAKSTRGAREVLERFGLLGYFDFVQGMDGLPGKPDPAIVVRALEALGARPEEALLVGDVPVDILAGRAAGVRTCAALYGYGDPKELLALQPDFVIRSPAELVPAQGANSACLLSL